MKPGGWCAENTSSVPTWVTHFQRHTKVICFHLTAFRRAKRRLPGKWTSPHANSGWDRFMSWCTRCNYWTDFSPRQTTHPDCQFSPLLLARCMCTTSSSRYTLTSDSGEQSVYVLDIRTGTYVQCCSLACHQEPIKWKQTLVPFMTGNRARQKWS